MFIKILTPNHNGKIELTVRDLEALIQEAVDKAVKEKCSSCNHYYYGNGFTLLNISGSALTTSKANSTISSVTTQLDNIITEGVSNENQTLRG